MSTVQRPGVVHFQCVLITLAGQLQFPAKLPTIFLDLHP